MSYHDYSFYNNSYPNIQHDIESMDKQVESALNNQYFNSYTYNQSDQLYEPKFKIVKSAIKINNNADDVKASKEKLSSNSNSNGSKPKSKINTYIMILSYCKIIIK